MVIVGSRRWYVSSDCSSGRVVIVKSWLKGKLFCVFTKRLYLLVSTGAWVAVSMTGSSVSTRTKWKLFVPICNSKRQNGRITVASLPLDCLKTLSYAETGSSRCFCWREVVNLVIDPTFFDIKPLVLTKWVFILRWWFWQELVCGQFGLVPFFFEGQWFRVVLCRHFF